ncbi:MAG: hypothetical protein II973_01680 [Spirochaetaceae bacterium]|nr:hypothetical protein [Spirochaetaceae bacterium]
MSARFTTVDPIRDGANWFSYVVNDPVNYVDPFGLTATDSKGGNVTFNQNVFSNPFVGYNEPQVTFETSSQTNNSYYGIDIGNSITVACGSMSTIGNCFGSKANKGFSLNNGTILGHNDVYIGGQNNETQSSNLIKQASMEMFIGKLLDNGSPLIGGAFAYVTGGSSLLAIPVIKTIGISLQIDAAAKLAKGTLLAVEKNSGGENWWDEYENDDYQKRERIGKSKGNAPRNNKVQNEQADDISKRYNLTDDEREQLHRMCTNQGYGYSELEELAKEIISNR